MDAAAKRLLSLRNLLAHARDRLGIDVGFVLWDGSTVPSTFPAVAFTIVLADEGAVAALIRRPTLDTILNLWVSARFDLRNGTLFDLAAQRPRVKTKDFIRSLDKRLAFDVARRFLLVPRGGPWPLADIKPDLTTTHSFAEDKAALPSLIGLLKDDDRKVRAAAVGTLGRFGPDAKEAVPALLRALAGPVTRFDAQLAALVADMDDTMRHLNGAGIAAPQIGVSARVVIFELKDNPRYPDLAPVPYTVLVNPLVTPLCAEQDEGWEGCLSVPGIFDDVKRASTVRVRAQDRDGVTWEKDFDEILAVCIQHEMDHLEGRLFVDYLSDLKRERIRKKLDKERRERSSAPHAPAASATRRAY